MIAENIWEFTSDKGLPDLASLDRVSLQIGRCCVYTFFSTNLALFFRVMLEKTQTNWSEHTVISPCVLRHFEVGYRPTSTIRRNLLETPTF